MRTIYLLFLRWFVKVALITVPSIVGIILILDKLGVPYNSVVYMAPGAVGYAVLLLPSLLIRKNLQWFMSLPISKRDILALSYGINVTMTLHVVLVACLSIGLVYLVMTGEFRVVPKLMFFEGVIKGLNAINKTGRIPVGTLAILVAAFTGFNALMLHIWAGGSTQSTQSKPLQAHNPKRTAKIVMGFVGLWVMFYVVRGYMMTGWTAFAAVTLGFCVFATHVTAYAMGAFGREKKRWLMVAWIIAILELGGVYATAWAGLKSNSPQRVSESLNFLGPWAGPASRETIGRLIASDISPRQLESIGEKYKQPAEPGKGAETTQVSFQAAVLTKSSFSALEALLSVFHHSSLTAEDIWVLFRRVSEVAPDVVLIVSSHYELLDIPLTRAETIRFLESDDLSAYYYGLLRCRYDRDPAFVPVILKNLGRYDDRRKLYALETLSILYGRRVGLDDYVESRQTGAIRGEFYVPSCGILPKSKFEDFEKSDEAWLNACGRARAKSESSASRRFKKIRAAESAGWIELPFDENEQWIVMRLLNPQMD